MIDSEKFEFILNTASQESGIHKDQIVGKSRKDEIVFVRHIVVSIAKKYTKLSLKGIGKGLSNRDHSTIINSIDESKNLYDQDLSYQNLYDRIENIVSAKFGITLPNKRYFDIIDSAIKAFVFQQLEQRKSDKCFIGSYVFAKTGIRNTGWYEILIDGPADASEEDKMCFKAIDYSNKEKKILLNKFDNAPSVFVGVFIASEAAHNMEDWSKIDEQVNLVSLIKDKNILAKIKKVS